MMVLDLESYRDQLDDRYMNWKMGDIKAPANYKDPDKIDAYIASAKVEALDKLALSPLTGKIILMGLMFDKEPKFEHTKYSIGMKDVFHVALQGEEIDILNNFWMLFSIYTLNDVDVVSYNGKAFDLPFIMNRSIINKIKMPRKISMSDYLSKYRHTPHFDVYNWLGTGSLVEWSYRFGLTDSLQRDGNKIGTWYETGQMQLIIDKNLIDITQTTLLYQQIKDMI